MLTLTTVLMLIGLMAVPAAVGDYIRNRCPPTSCRLGQLRNVSCRPTCERCGGPLPLQEGEAHGDDRDKLKRLSTSPYLSNSSGANTSP